MRGTRSIIPAAMVVALLAACTPAAVQPGWTYSPTTGGGQPNAPAPTTGAGGGGAGGTVLGTIELKGIDIGYEPAHVEVEKAGRYEVKFNNTGTIGHDVTFPDGTKVVAKSGETVSAEVDVPAEGLTFECSVPGHKDAGMT